VSPRRIKPAIATPSLERGGCEKVFEEKISGVVRKRPQLEKLLGEVRKGDVLVVTRLDRIARSTAELLIIAERFKRKEPAYSLG